ncbi:Predicted arabinose efflux permease, MFS family [Modestobacter sp. DSM 44400]|uniref:MFS transporter n=1 Tax=Modestobacter sp. DSM 44400 TaxID=1550230 RepID=UPI00089D1BCA|nr:MFS transporter [Modestobacter sp. DSM 44400]SDX92154.1 Predicted arabinose efflux permease, MFS family [Modestobacter sp. DSM 44400]
MSEPRGRRLLGLLLLHSALTQVVTFVLRPAATYRAIELDVPPAWLGALTACFAVVPLFLAVPAGQATDRLGERRVLLAGSLLMLAAGVVFVFAGAGAPGLVAGIAVLGTAHLFCVVAQQAAVANAAGPGTFDTAFGRYTFAASLGQAIGPGLIILAGGGQAIPDTATLFLVATALGGVLVVCAAPIRIPRRERPTGSAAAGGLASLLRLPGLLRALVISCVVLAAVDITLVYLPALGAERELAAGFIGLLLTLRALASMTSRLLLGRLARWLGRRRLMIISVTMSAVAMAAVGLPLPPWATAVLVVLLGLGLGVGQPLTMSWLAETAPAGLRGRAMSLRLTGNRLGQVVIPSAVGAVAVGIGAAGVLGTTAVALAVVAAAARKLQTDGSRTPEIPAPSTPSEEPAR